MPNDILIGGEVGNDSIVGDIGVFQVTVAGAANDVLQSNEAYTEDVQNRRKIWSVFAQELGIQESSVNITNIGIKIEGVATFELNDDEPASYYELVGGEKGGLKNLPQLSVRNAILDFMASWSKQQQLRFLDKVMCMDVHSKGIGSETRPRNFYIFNSTRDNGVEGLLISSISGVTDGWFNPGAESSIRHIKN